MPKTIERTIEIDRSVNEVWGVLVDFVGLFGGTLDATGEGFEQMNQALKLRCESR
ncbi:MAG: hypothetical protein QOC87_1720 [Actinomycetota bacterium]|jgi:hypothetical protein|nr:hypothetical protein [Actinomycetota bacterium]